MADGDPLILGNRNRSDDITLLERSGTIARFALSIINSNGGGLRARATGEAATGVRGEATVGTGSHGQSDSGIGVLGEARGSVSSAEGVVGLGVDNNGVRGTSDSGIGVRGESTNEAGVAGVSKSADGVLGSAAGSVGVRGASGSSYAVHGEASQGVGVKGTGLHYGVIGDASFAGVKGSSTGYGVFGESSTGYGVCGASAGGAGVRGATNTGTGVEGVSSGKFGMYGYAPVGTGMHGESIVSTGVAGVSIRGSGVSGISNRLIGVRGESRQIGVYGVSNPSERVAFPGGYITPKGVVGTSDEGIGVVGGSYGGGWAAVFQGRTQIFGDLSVSGRKSAVVPHPDGTHRLTYCVEATESWFEDFGRASLKGGAATVEIDPDFAALIDPDDYHVYLTPEGPTEGLYIDGRSPGSFNVREQREGSSSIDFSYRIVARRKDVPRDRLKVFEPPPPVSDELIDEPFEVPEAPDLPEAPEEKEIEMPELPPEPEPPRKLPRKFLPRK